MCAGIMTLAPPQQAGPILLVGFMGAGKSSVGRVLARELDCGFVDLDQVIESRAGRTIVEIFAGGGESVFRRFESQALGDLLANGSTRTIIALGGGTYVQPSNQELIARSTGRVVYLEVSLEEAFRRLQGFGKERPLAADAEGFERLFHQRRPVYEQAHFRMSTTDKTVEQVAKELAAWVREQDRQ